MRYWHPMAEETVTKVKDYNPDKIILLPLYPQFSTTTSDSSIKDWHENAAKQNLEKPTEVICCYPRDENFIKAHLDLIKKSLNAA